MLSGEHIEFRIRDAEPSKQGIGVRYAYDRRVYRSKEEGSSPPVRVIETCPSPTLFRCLRLCRV
jgi:hypothetical protein